MGEGLIIELSRPIFTLAILLARFVQIDIYTLQCVI